MIRLSLATDYALRTLLILAARPDEQISTREVAEFYGISADHVSKVVQQLAHAGMVRAGRGRGGGLRLGRPADQISIGEVVELFEGPVTLLDCVSSSGVCVIQPGCRLRTVLKRAGDRLAEDLRGVTLAELVKPGAAPFVSLSQLQGTM